MRFFTEEATIRIDRHIAVTDADTHRRKLTAAVTAGDFHKVLPGVYVEHRFVDHLNVLCEAVTRWRSDAVIVGATAYALATGDGSRILNSSEIIEVSAPNVRFQSDRFQFTRRCPPASEIITSGFIRTTTLAYAALAMLPVIGAAQVLKDLIYWQVPTRRLSALLPAFDGSPEQRERRRLVQQLVDNPFSPGEEQLQSILRQAGLNDWVSNLTLRLSGITTTVDIWFPKPRLAIEFDGLSYHSSEPTFTRDRRKGNLLVTHGIKLLRFTWPMLDDEKYVVATVKAALGTT